MANLSNINNKFLVTTGGNVGINTTSPGQKLVVTGNIGTSGSVLFDDNQGINFGNSNAKIYGSSSDGIKFNAGGSEGMRFNQSGNLGIGTTNPGTLHGASYGTTRLQIDGGTDRGQLIIEGDSFAGIVLSDNGATANQRVFATSVDEGKYTIKPLNDNGTSTAQGVAVTVLHGGNVGIGTTTPATFLQVSGAGNRAGGNIQMGLSSQGADKWSYLTGTHYNSTTEPEGFALIGGYSDIDENRVVIGGDIWETNPATSIHFWTHSSSTHAQGGTERMRINSSGNVGIGVNPSGNTDRLQIDNPANPTSIRIGDNTTDDCYVVFNTDGNDWSIGTDRSDSNKFKISDYSRVGTNDRLVIDTSGNVGIGTTSPSAKLEVAFDGSHTSGDISYTQANIDVYNPLQANTDEKGSIITFTDNYFDGTNYPKTTRAAIKGGTDTVGNTANGFLAFYTDSGGANSATERMRIDSSGNLGIGTTSPSAKLEVVTAVGGDAIRLNFGQSADIFLGFNSANPRILLQDNSNVVTHNFQSNGDNYIVGNNVGIGTTSPDYKLEVQGVISSADSALQKATFANVGADLVLTANADATNVTAKILFNSSGSGGGSVSEKMSIQGDGSVIIGSTTLGGNKTLKLLSADNAVNYDIDFQQNGTTNHGRIRYTEGAADLEFYPITGVNPNLTLKFNGNSYFQRGSVGIGKTAPKGSLDVAGAITSGIAQFDPNISLSSNGATPQNGGALEISQAWSVSTSSGDTIVFSHDSVSWKSWILHYNFASTAGLTSGMIGGYWNNSGGQSNVFIVNALGASVVVTHAGQSIIVTFTFTNLGTHPLASFKFMQGGGDGQPLASKTSITINS